MPPTLRGLIAARIDRLPLAAKVTLQHASVVGRFDGPRVNVEQIPRLPTFPVLEDPRQRPYLVFWVAEDDGAVRYAPKMAPTGRPALAEYLPRQLGADGTDPVGAVGDELGGGDELEAILDKALKWGIGLPNKQAQDGGHSQVIISVRHPLGVDPFEERAKLEAAQDGPRCAPGRARAPPCASAARSPPAP